MRQNRWLWQAVICLVIFVSVHSNLGAVTVERYEKIGTLIDRITEVIRENYTLAELLQMGEKAADAAVSAPARISSAVIAANEQSFYGHPLDLDPEDGETVQLVYASAGGRVLKSGLQEGLGLYVMVEHQSKISTYGHLSSVRVLEGDRVIKGEILGSYDGTSDHDFYYTLEEKS